MDEAAAINNVDGATHDDDNNNKDNTSSSFPSTHHTDRAKIASDMAKRIAGGANLQTLARDQNMTVEQVCRMVAMFADQAGEIARATLGSDTMYNVIAENKEGQGKAIQDQCEQEMMKANHKESNGLKNGAEEEKEDGDEATKIPPRMPQNFNPFVYYRL
ncbi:hypothetical protein H2204_001028 [Knufia peltigerae]|uniref:Uncharacterized protein n=1 Tax=Knufia peltigerae TaxID=1002370 RepID=A0AA38YDI6_9EURO|nr:hypothetical protein H2204_001028 [Knufia peltigerae]